MATLIITEKTSQAKDLAAALGGRYGKILPAEGHLLRLAEPDEIDPAWKRWSCALLKPDGLYPTRPASGAPAAIAKIAPLGPSVTAELDALARQGYRVLTVASGPPQQLSLLGLVALSDPPGSIQGNCSQNSGPSA